MCRPSSQSVTSHLSTIVRMDPADGGTRNFAVGVRSSQRLAVYGTGADARLDFVDITSAPSVTRQDVFRVNLLDSRLQPITLSGLTGGQRPDPRFFNFPDGSAGVLLERTGDCYRLTEVTTTK